jgi:hypothetical protein
MMSVGEEKFGNDSVALMYRQTHQVWKIEWWTSCAKGTEATI